MDGLIRSFVCAPSFALSRDVTPGTQQATNKSNTHTSSLSLVISLISLSQQEAESQNMNMNRHQHAGHSIDHAFRQTRTGHKLTKVTSVSRTPLKG